MTPERVMTWREFVKLLRQWRYTGALLVHCAEGTLQRVEVPQPPLRMKLDNGLTEDAD